MRKDGQQDQQRRHVLGGAPQAGGPAARGWGRRRGGGAPAAAAGAGGAAAAAGAGGGRLGVLDQAHAQPAVAALAVVAARLGVEALALARRLDRVVGGGKGGQDGGVGLSIALQQCRTCGSDYNQHAHCSR